MTRRGRRWLQVQLQLSIGASALLVALATTRAAKAEDTLAPPSASASDADQEQARELFRAGLARLDAAQYVEALDSFEHAYALWKNPKILLNIAAALRATGQAARSANAYVKYQQTASAEPARMEEVSRILQELDAGLGRLAFSGFRGGERVWLNDTELTVQAGTELRVDPGEYTLRIARPLALPHRQRLVVRAGERHPVDPPALAPTRNMDSADPAPENGAAASDRPPRGVPTSREPSKFPVTQLPILVRADFDVARRGGVGAIGLGFAALDFLRITGGALVGARPGAWLGLEFLPIEGPVVPVLGISFPTFLVDGVHPGISTEAGLRVALSRRLAPFARTAVAYFPTAPDEYVSLVFVPSVGMEVSL